jgi:hypothetical protein
MSSPSSASSSSSSSPVHHASLVDPSSHSPALLDLVQVKLSKKLIHYVVEVSAETVDFALGRPKGKSSQRTKFTTFVTDVLTRAEVTTPVVLAALVYIDRAKPHLHIALEEWALERVFLGALVTASKYLNDSTLKNVHWALCTGVFGKRDVGRIEREFLDVLDWELSISEADILSHHAGISAAIASSPSLHHSSHHRHQLPSHHVRSHHHSSCPELEPSSPISSDGSTSPQTPSTLNNSPLPSKGTSSKPESGIRELIKAFPIPSHPSHFPIQV